MDRVFDYLNDRRTRTRSKLDAYLSDLLLILCLLVGAIGILVALGTGSVADMFAVWFVAALLFALSVYLWIEW